MAYEKLFKEYFRQILNYKNHKIFDIEHSEQRYSQRVGNNIQNYKNLLKKGINWIIKNNKEEVEDRYIFISRKYGFGIQVHWRQDRYGNTFNGYSATSFSNDEMNFFTHADKELFLEQAFERYGQRLKENDYYRYRFNNNSEFEIEINKINLDLFIEDGKVYKTYEFIEI